MNSACVITRLSCCGHRPVVFWLMMSYVWHVDGHNNNNCASVVLDSFSISQDSLSVTSPWSLQARKQNIASLRIIAVYKFETCSVLHIEKFAQYISKWSLSRCWRDAAEAHTFAHHYTRACNTFWAVLNSGERLWVPSASSVEHFGLPRSKVPARFSSR